MKTNKTFEYQQCLSYNENLLISSLVYFPEDKNEMTKYLFSSDEDKILAIALYDCWKGSDLHNDIVRRDIVKIIWNKLFTNQISGLF
jgi:hypothetical protein